MVCEHLVEKQGRLRACLRDKVGVRVWVKCKGVGKGVGEGEGGEGRPPPRLCMARRAVCRQ